jgi:DNA-binding PadR family transcriptional regulator
MAKLQHHWLHPQTIPRGFLRLYILTLLSRGSETGYSIIQRIDERTEGAWRPGAGTMYPLLKSLLREGLVKASGPKGRGGSKTYAITQKGKREIEKTRRLFAGVGRKEPVMSRLFSDLLPGAVFVPMMVRRYRDGAETIRQKFNEVPEPDRETLLRELRLLMESQIQWIDSELRPQSARAHPSD